MSAADSDDRRVFPQYDRGLRTLLGLLIFGVGVVVLCLPLSVPEERRETLVPYSTTIGIAICQLALAVGLYRGTYVIDRSEDMLMYRWGWLGLTFGQRNLDLASFARVFVLRERVATGAASASERYLVLLRKQERDVRLLSFDDHATAMQQGQELADWLGWPLKDLGDG